MSANQDMTRLWQVLLANKDKSFVKRILERDKYPTLPVENGQVATHMMSWSEADGKYRVYPTVLWDGKALKRYTPQDAYQNVLKTNNYIDFDTPEEAEWFSKNYKLVWGK